MAAYWIMLIWVTIIGFLVVPSKADVNIDDNGSYDLYVKRGVVWLLVSVPLIFCALRSGFVDTWGYIQGFKQAPDIETYANIYTRNKSCQLFYGLQSLFKYGVIDNAHCWLALNAFVQMACIVKILRKYSAHIGISIYIFIASGMILSWMFNGIKQFTVACILFACTDWVLEHKWIRYFIVLLILTGLGQLYGMMGWGEPPWYLCGIHQTAIIMIPIVLCASGKMLNIKTWILMIVLAGILYSGSLNSFLETATEHTDYANDLKYLGPEHGMNIIRFFVSLVPPVMVLVKKRQIMAEGVPDIISLSINMSFVSASIYLVAVFSSGIFIRRLPIYCEIYNLILYPWLLLHPYRKEKQLLIPIMCVCFAIYYFYQVYVSFGEPYYSDVLTILNGI